MSDEHSRNGTPAPLAIDLTTPEPTERPKRRPRPKALVPAGRRTTDDRMALVRPTICLWF